LERASSFHSETGIGVADPVGIERLFDDPIAAELPDVLGQQ
jgi:hypothetical protein